MRQRFADCILVVDNKPKMATLVSRLSPALLQCEELVAQIDEGRSAALAPKLEFEQSTVESQSLFDVTDFERYVVETNRARGVVTLSEIGPIWTINQQAKSLKSLASTLAVVGKFRSV